MRDPYLPLRPVAHKVRSYTIGDQAVAPATLSLTKGDFSSDHEDLHFTRSGDRP